MFGIISPETSRGFTLIEILVVLMIMALFVGLVGTIAWPNERDVLRVEAQRLAQLLDLAAAESRLSGKPIGWTADGSGYRFWQFRTGTGWSEIRDNDLLRARSLPHGMMISALRVENMRPQGVMRLEFTPYELMLAFDIEMSFGGERCVIAGSPVGDVRVLPIEGRTDGEIVLR